MRLLLAFLSVFLLAAAPAHNWTETVTVTPAGTYVIGNPAARVKLAEYASYTCPHCGAFSRESAAVLKGQMIRDGSTSLEVRHLLRDRLDLAAVVLARCGGPRIFADLHSAIFAAQDQWLARGADFQDSNASRLSAYALPAQLKLVADGAGLTAIAAAHGLPPAKAQACFANKAMVDKIVAMSATWPEAVHGTPTFFINGKQVPDVASWAPLQPLLRAAGAH